MSQDNSYTLHNMIPDQFKISKISLTKLLIEFNEEPLFEENAKNFEKLAGKLNDILMYNAALVSTKIIPRKIIYKEFEAVLKNIDPNIRKNRLESIINEKVNFFYHNELILWIAKSLMENECNINKINDKIL